MNQKEEPQTAEVQRDIIRTSLSEITVELNEVLHKADIHYPIYLAIPNTGEAIVLIGTPFDPTDADWSYISTALCQILESRLVATRLRSRELQCAMANTPIGATAVTAG